MKILSTAEKKRKKKKKKKKKKEREKKKEGANKWLKDVVEGFALRPQKP